MLLWLKWSLARSSEQNYELMWLQPCSQPIAEPMIWTILLTMVLNTFCSSNSCNLSVVSPFLTNKCFIPVCNSNQLGSNTFLSSVTVMWILLVHSGERLVWDVRRTVTPSDPRIVLISTTCCVSSAGLVTFATGKPTFRSHLGFGSLLDDARTLQLRSEDGISRVLLSWLLMVCKYLLTVGRLLVENHNVLFCISKC